MPQMLPTVKAPLEMVQSVNKQLRRWRNTFHAQRILVNSFCFGSDEGAFNKTEASTQDKVRLRSDWPDGTALEKPVGSFHV